MPVPHREGPDASARSPRLPLATAVVATLLLALGALGTVRFAGEAAADLVQKQLLVQQLTGVVTHLDEVLTMSANMCAHTGDMKWKERYDRHLAPLDEAIAGLRSVSPGLFDQELGADTDAANQRLVAMETKSFELVEQGRASDAAAILDGPAYAADKALYAAGNQRAQLALAGLVTSEREATRSHQTLASVATLLLAILATGSWVVVSRRSREQRSRVALELARATSRAADEANRQKSLFVANTSHELRTPLTAILGYAELLADPKYAAENAADACATITRNGEHLLQVVNDLLDMSKIEAGGLTVESVPTDPALIVEDVVSLMRVRATGKGITLDRTFETPLPRSFPCDPVRLRQILLNLVGNAIKFTPNGRVALRIEFRPETDGGGTLRFAVEDSGIGMTEEQVGRLFRRFAQAEDSTARRFGGTGLGLALSKTFAELLGGGVLVRSCPGVGSTFTLELPVPADSSTSTWHPDADGIAAMHEERAQAAAYDDELPNLAGVRILLADDGVDNRRLVAHHLVHCGAEVVTAENGRDAVASLLGDAAPRFDLVLMDMQMPELDGYRATHLLRERGWAAPIVALTANAMSTDRERCLQAGCDDYLTKPIDRRKLLRTCALWARPGLACAT
ncbi:MAG: response regulator [Planctomycetes bacterium]|nr:response regulator [Planctomycetota bacterium]